MKKTLCLFLCLIMAFGALPISAQAADKSKKTSVTQEDDTNTSKKKKSTSKKKKVKKVSTKVTGIKHSFNCKKSQKVAFTVKVSPAKPSRKILLQRYSSEKEEYVTKKTYKTKEAKTAKVTISIPKKYRNRTYGKWRIVVEPSEKAKGFRSKPIKVYTTNIETLKLSSKTSCIYCLDTGKVIYDKKMNKRQKPASCTKIMTLITLIESGKFNGTSPVTYKSRNVAAQRLNAYSGDRYRNRDLAYAMILGSANDAAVMIATGVSGSERNYARRMNRIVRKIGIKHTHFTNTYGSPNKRHYTTAYDLSRITAYGYRYDRFCQVVGKEQYGFRSVKYHKRYGCYTADHMVRRHMKGHIGGKTGYSEVLGASYSGLYKYKGRVYAVTQMNARTKPLRWKDVSKLYKYVRKYGKSKY